MKKIKYDINCITLFLLLTLSIALSAANFSPPNLEQIRQPGNRDLALPKYTPIKEAILQPPPVPPLKKKNFSQTPHLWVRKFQFDGNHQFSDDALTQLTKKYQNRTLSTEELQFVRQLITRHYINHGFINSGVIIPNQDPKAGIIRLQIIEGKLDKIIISGNHRLKETYLSSRIRQGATTPLNINALQKQILLLQRNPRIAQINAQLIPGSLPGKAILKAQLTEQNPFYFNLQLDNHRSPAVGSGQLSMQFSHINLSGRGDEFGARLGLTEGLESASLHYFLPLTANDVNLKINWDNSTSEVIEAPFNLIDIESESSSTSIALSYPLSKTLIHEYRLSAGFEKRHSTTFAGRQQTSFSLGVNDGRSKVSVLQLSFDALHQSLNQVISYRSSLRFGLDTQNATINNDGRPDGRFITLLGQFLLSKRLNTLKSQLIFISNGQYSNTPLLPLEKFAIGGVQSVRGYRENQFVRDLGIFGSLEWRIPIFANKTRKSAWQLSPFVDMGWSRNKEQSANQSQKTLSSIGLGLRWDPVRQIHGELYWGYALRDIKTPSYNLQDDGIHLQFRYRYQ